MAIEIHERVIPDLISWFNTFLGFREIQRRIERVEAKLSGLGFASLALRRRYAFHATYPAIVTRNRLRQRIDFRQLENHRVLSSIAALRELSKDLSDQARARLRSRALEALTPDGDVRALEHELRAFVHYRQAGLKVLFIDGEDGERFDFLVKGSSSEFEVECKTFGENVGNAISFNDSIVIFRTLKAAIQESDSFHESGMLTLTFADRTKPSETEIRSFVSSFLSKAPREIEHDMMKISFERKLDWEQLLRDASGDAIITEIDERQAAENCHTMIMLSRTQAVMSCLASTHPSRPINAICRRLKDASEQLSGKRPGVIWGHFLGINEHGFRELIERPNRAGAHVFELFGRYVFKSAERKHVCRVRLSVDEEALRRIPNRLIVPGRSGSISGGGLAYDLTSRVSAFDPVKTQ